MDHETDRLLTTMTCTITSYRFKDYLDHTHPDIVRVIWKVKAPELNARVLANLPNLQHLDCSGRGLTSLQGLVGCPGLLSLNCSFNNLSSLDGIQFCPDLEVLNCSKNRLRRLGHGWVDKICRLFTKAKPVGIEGCLKLKELDCSICNLQSLEGIQACTQLLRLECGYNTNLLIEHLEHLTVLQHLNMCSINTSTLQPIRNCTSLRKLRCSTNNLITLEGIEGLHRLEWLSCNDNSLTSIRSVSHCPRLQAIDCSNNQITRLDPVILLRDLVAICTDGNPLDIQSPPVERFLEGIRNRRFCSDKTIYDNRQNVHDTQVQKSVCESVANLMGDLRPEFSIDTIIKSGLDAVTIRHLLHYCADQTVHSEHKLTYCELLGYVWQRIMRSKDSDEMFRILAEQAADADGLCFTGRFNRTLSVLVGFYPDIRITISDSSRIGAIVLVIKNRLKPYDVDTHRTIAHRELKEAGYTEEEIRPWIDAIEV